MSFQGKIMASRVPLRLNRHFNMQPGAANSYYNAQMQLQQMNWWQQMATYQMMNTPSYTVQTHENHKTYNGSGFLGKVFGGIVDIAKSAVGAYTGTQIGGYTDTVTTFGGYGPNQNITLNSSGGWGETIGGLLSGSYKKSGTSVTQSQPQTTVSPKTDDNHKADIDQLSILHPNYNIIYRDGKFMASNKDNTTTITADTFDEMDNKLKADTKTYNTTNDNIQANQSNSEEISQNNDKNT